MKNNNDVDNNKEKRIWKKKKIEPLQLQTIVWSFLHYYVNNDDIVVICW